MLRTADIILRLVMKAHPIENNKRALAFGNLPNTNKTLIGRPSIFLRYTPKAMRVEINNHHF